jgi:hypothetical protein
MDLYTTIPTKIRKRFGKTYETMGAFCFVMSITGLNRHNTERNDDDDSDGGASGEDGDNDHIHKSVKIQTFVLSIVKTFLMM